jgi:hypothetical protein
MIQPVCKLVWIKKWTYRVFSNQAIGEGKVSYYFLGWQSLKCNAIRICVNKHRINSLEKKIIKRKAYSYNQNQWWIELDIHIRPRFLFFVSRVTKNTYIWQKVNHGHSICHCQLIFMMLFTAFIVNSIIENTSSISFHIKRNFIIFDI